MVAPPSRPAEHEGALVSGELRMNHILVLFHIMAVIVWIGGSRKLAGDGLPPSWVRRRFPILSQTLTISRLNACKIRLS
jgi:hypothetical protein